MKDGTIFHCLYRTIYKAVSASAVFVVLTACTGYNSYVSEEDRAEDERRLFSRAKAHFVLIEDTEVVSYVECVSNRLIKQLPREYSELSWEVAIFDENTINAFALSIGKIGLFSGVLRVARNEHELAAVIAHEIAHVTERHAIRNQTAFLAADTAGAILGVFLPGAGTIGGASLYLSYSREQEIDADRVALKYLATAGFNPQASLQLLERMNEYEPQSKATMFSRHPSGEKRSAELAERMAVATDQYEETNLKTKFTSCDNQG